MKNATRFELSDRQLEAYDVLTLDKNVSELVFGGGARGGKSMLGSFWVITECGTKPGSAWIIAREELKALRRTTMRTFFKVLRMLGYRKDEHYFYNGQDLTLTFANSSIVFFAELKRLPSDPEFDRIGSYDLTGAWIDEAQEVVKDAKDALQFRFSVMDGNGWVAHPKALYTCNPSKNWIYSDFWKPIVKDKKKVEGRAFITSLFSDNPWIDQKKYKEAVLRTKNKVKIERLLYGNFEYDDSPHRIFVYDKILDLFTNKAAPSDEKFITCDVARTGDRIVTCLWRGLQVVRVFCQRDRKIPETAAFLNELAEKEQVPHSNVAIDADGMGVGVLDLVPNARAFHNGAAPIQPADAEWDETRRLNMANLKTQCYIMLADLVNAGKIGVDEIGDQERQDLIEELDVQKQINVDTDKKVEIEKKEKIKELLGRSPDIADAMMMRMFFELSKTEGTFEII